MAQTIALISDIHANAAAFNAVKKDIKARNIDAVWCLGDIVGRGPEDVLTARRVYRLYKQQATADQAHWLSGNHDWLVLGKLSQDVFMDADTIVGTESGLNQKALDVALHHADNLANISEIWAWLQGLPSYYYAGDGIYLVHGVYLRDEAGVIDRHSVSLYGYPQNLKRMMLNMRDHLPDADQPRLILLGHTHIAGIWRWDATAETITQQPADETVTLTDLGTSPAIINPGSVGFPRGSDCPTYAVLSFGTAGESLTVDFHEVSYDPSVNTIPDTYAYPPQYIDEMKRCGGSSTAE